MLIEFRLSLCTTLQRRVYTENIPSLLCKLIHMQQTLSQNCPTHECIAPARERCWRVLPHHHHHLRLQIQSSLPPNSIALACAHILYANTVSTHGRALDIKRVLNNHESSMAWRRNAHEVVVACALVDCASAEQTQCRRRRVSTAKFSGAKFSTRDQ